MLDRLRSHSFSYQAPVLVCLLAILLLVGRKKLAADARKLFSLR